jgi:hypothetical protein
MLKIKAAMYFAKTGHRYAIGPAKKRAIEN